MIVSCELKMKPDTKCSVEEVDNSFPCNVTTDFEAFFRTKLYVRRVEKNGLARDLQENLHQLSIYHFKFRMLHTAEKFL